MIKCFFLFISQVVCLQTEVQQLELTLKEQQLQTVQVQVRDLAQISTTYTLTLFNSTCVFLFIVLASSSRVSTEPHNLHNVGGKTYNSEKMPFGK